MAITVVSYSGKASNNHLSKRLKAVECDLLLFIRTRVAFVNVAEKRQIL
jgi:hypothetical protein